MSAQIRIADALLQSVGGRTVLLRMPAPGAAGDLGEETGLAAPVFQDMELGPVVFRKLRAVVATGERARVAEQELLVSASAVQRVVGSLEYGSANVLFAQACGVLVDGMLLQITSAASVEGFGTVYLYRLGLKGSAAGLV